MFVLQGGSCYRSNKNGCFSFAQYIYIYIYMSFRIVYTIPQLWKLVICKRGVGENMVWELSHGVLF